MSRVLFIFYFYQHHVSYPTFYLFFWQKACLFNKMEKRRKEFLFLLKKESTWRRRNEYRSHASNRAALLFDMNQIAIARYAA